MAVHVPSRNVSGGEPGQTYAYARYPRVSARVDIRVQPAEISRSISKSLADPDALPYGDASYCPGCHGLAAWDPRCRRLRHLADGTPVEIRCHA